MEKKNTDYSASAVNLCNPPEVGEVLRGQIARQLTLKQLKQQADDCVPEELRQKIQALGDEIVKENDGLREYIDTFGSYQDLELGIYAVKQRTVSKSYNAVAFERIYPQYAPAVIIKAVDTTKLNGLIKGGLLNEDDLKHPDMGVIKETESYRYIIK
jgi:hypothetical protein